MNPGLTATQSSPGRDFSLVCYVEKSQTWSVCLSTLLGGVVLLFSTFYPLTTPPLHVPIKAEDPSMGSASLMGGSETGRGCK